MDVGAEIPSVRIELLGPLRVFVGQASVRVSGPKRRAVLVLLAFAQGRTVPVAQLVDALWSSEAAGSGRAALQAHISRLRGHLGPASGRLLAVSDGYRLDLGSADLDVSQARRLLAQARTDLSHDPEGALGLLREAYALWRGPQLSDLTDVSEIATCIAECQNLHSEVTDALIRAAIESGHADEFSGMAVSRLAADPLREPSVLLAMRALASAGQAAEALAVGRRFRWRSAAEVGLDPSPALSALEREIAGGVVGPASTKAVSPARWSRTRLIGRDRQVAELSRLVAKERLVTLVGPGGVGKTSVALSISSRMPEATVLLLAPLTEPAAMDHALAAALNVNVVRGDVLAACVAVLGDSERLLVVDNCEHLLDAARDVIVTLLASCRRLTILATSRESLGVPEEFTYRLAPLPLPSVDRTHSAAASVELFVDRARRIQPYLEPTAAQLQAMGDIVSRLDGIPLAIELAAGRLTTFSVSDLRDRLDRSLDLLGGGRPTSEYRHRTLRSTIEWSYNLLDPDEQRLFRHLAVFPDGIDLDAAENLAGDLDITADPGAVLARLVDASVINVDFSGSSTRYRILETIRAYGIDRLTDAGEKDSAEDLLLRWAVDLSADIGATLMTDDEPKADATLRKELGNLRTAWRLARSLGALDAAVSMINSLFDAISYRDLIEMRGWAQELAGDPALLEHPAAPIALGVAAEAVYHCGDTTRSEALSRAGLDLAITPLDEWVCLATLSVTALARGEYLAVIEYCLKAENVTPRPAEPLGVAALAALYSGDIEQARLYNERGAGGARFPSMVAWNAYVAGEIENYAGNGIEAEDHYIRAIELGRISGATFLVGVATVGLLTVRSRSGRLREALQGYREVIDYFTRTGNWTHLWAALRNLADLLDDLDDLECAAMLHAAADQAPDAPANDRPPAPDVPVPGRSVVLAAAYDAIDQQLARLD